MPFIADRGSTTLSAIGWHLGKQSGKLQKNATLFLWGKNIEKNTVLVNCTCSGHYMRHLSKGCVNDIISEFFPS